MKQSLPVKDLVDTLAREEQALKRAGAFGEAAGIRDAIVKIFRMADEGEEGIEPESE